MNTLNDIYKYLPYIIGISIMLNIIGNMIKITFKIPGKYIIWILLLISIMINFIFYKINFESLFLAFISFSFAVSGYDLLKYFFRIINKK